MLTTAKECHFLVDHQASHVRYTASRINPFPARASYLNFHPLEVVFRYREPQLQVGENVFICEHTFANLDVFINNSFHFL